MTLALVVPAVASADEPTSGACVHQVVRDKDSLKRRRREDQRDFVKALRHEIAAHGGWFVSDLFSATWSIGGSYTFHMTEDAAVEAAFTYTHADAELVRSIEDGRGEVIRETFSPMTFLTSSLVYYPLHGKLRAGGAIIHFDLHVDVGVGVVDSETSRGAAGVAGVGVKLFAGETIAIRLDVKDHIYRQELLDERFLVNDVAVTLGLATYLPFGF